MLFELKAGSVPLFNEYTQYLTVGGLVSRPVEYDDIDWYVKRVPELLRVVAAVQEDILGGDVFFEGKSQAVKKAETFWTDNFMKEELKKAIFDWLLYGDGYLWTGKFSKRELETIRAKTLSQLPESIRQYAMEFKADEDEINFVRHIPSTTMNIDLNQQKTAIFQFRQVVSALEVNKWNPSEVVHAKYWTLQGKVYGFSPARALLQEVQTIGYIKDYASTWFRDGGTPDWFFAFENEQPGSARVKDLISQLQKYKHPQEKHGNLVGTGVVKPTELNKFSKDMEFRQLLIQLTGIVAFAYGLPSGRITAIIGAEVKTSTGADDVSNEAYWSMIRNHMDYWEILLNTQIFKKFGDVKIHFPDTHKIDQVREAQAKMQSVDYFLKLRQLGVDFNLQMVKDHLGIKNEYLNSEEFLPLQLPPTFGGNFMQGYESNEKLERGTAREGLSNRKKAQQATANADKQNIGF